MRSKIVSKLFSVIWFFAVLAWIGGITHFATTHPVASAFLMAGSWILVMVGINHWSFWSVYNMHYPYRHFFKSVYYKRTGDGVPIAEEHLVDTYKSGLDEATLLLVGRSKVENDKLSEYFMSDLSDETKQRLNASKIKYWYDRRNFVFQEPKIYFVDAKSRATFTLMCK